MAAIAALLTVQIAISGRAFATDSSSDGLSTNHENKLRWLPFRPEQKETKVAESKCEKCEQCKSTACNSGECKAADCKQAGCQQFSGSAVHSVEVHQTSGESSSSKRSQIRLAAVSDESGAPVLTDPFDDVQAKPGYQQHQISITPEDVEAIPVPQSRGQRFTNQAPGELQSDNGYAAREMPGRSVKVSQPRAPAPGGAGPESQPYSPSDGLPDLDSPQRRGMQDPAEDCRDAYDKLHGHTLDKVSLDIKVTGKPGDDVPYECSLTTDQFSPRCWQLTTYTWKASALCHKPLYFEEESLERYGHSHGWICEDLVSCAHFFGNIALLPYHVGVETPCECIYDLGVYRVGDCAPYILDPFPISLRGCCTAAVGYGAVIALFP